MTPQHYVSTTPRFMSHDAPRTWHQHHPIASIARRGRRSCAWYTRSTRDASVMHSMHLMPSGPPSNELYTAVLVSAGSTRKEHTLRTLSLRPLVLAIKGFMTTAEAGHISQAAEKDLSRSGVRFNYGACIYSMVWHGLYRSVAYTSRAPGPAFNPSLPQAAACVSGFSPFLSASQYCLPCY